MLKSMYFRAIQRSQKLGVNAHWSLSLKSWGPVPLGLMMIACVWMRNSAGTIEKLKIKRYT